MVGMCLLATFLDLIFDSFLCLARMIWRAALACRHFLARLANVCKVQEHTMPATA